MVGNVDSFKMISDPMSMVFIEWYLLENEIFFFPEFVFKAKKQVLFYN